MFLGWKKERERHLNNQFNPEFHNVSTTSKNFTIEPRGKKRSVYESSDPSVRRSTSVSVA